MSVGSWVRIPEVLLLFFFFFPENILSSLTCTQNGVWMLGNLNTCRFLPLPGGEAKSSNLMMFYEGKKSMSMISWSRKGTQAN